MTPLRGQPQALPTGPDGRDTNLTPRHPRTTSPDQGQVASPDTPRILRNGHRAALPFVEPGTVLGPPVPRKEWTQAQMVRFVREGTVPRGMPSQLDHVKAQFARLALAMGDPQDPGLKRFLVQLDAAHTHDQAATLVNYHFVAPGEDELRFLPPPHAPAQGPDLTRLPGYGRMHAASGLGRAAFARLCEALSARAPFFEKVLSDPAHQPWGEIFFTQVGRELARCEPGEAAAVVLYHPDCYGVKRDSQGTEIVGKGITHISVMAITPQGDVCVNHQECIAYGGGGVNRNLMKGNVGLVSNGYDTRRLHERVAAALGGKPPAELPVDQSFRLHGGPAGMVTRLRSYENFAAHTGQLETRGASAEGLRLNYAADPDHVIRRLGADHKAGTLDDDALVRQLDSRTRLRDQPDVPALDEVPQAHLVFSNNCTLTTLLALKAGGCTVLDRPGRIHSAQSLQGLQQVLLDSGLMPCTDPALPQRAQATRKDADDINVKSFLTVGTGQATQKGLGLPADIPQGEELRRSRL